MTLRIMNGDADDHDDLHADDGDDGDHESYFDSNCFNTMQLLLFLQTDPQVTTNNR